MDMLNTRTSLTILALMTLGGAAAGCGGEDERASALTPAATAGATPEPTPEPTPSATAAAQDGAPAEAAVEIDGFTYVPDTVTVRAGGEVTWDNKDASNHTVTFEKDGPEDIGNLRDGATGTVAFDEAGSYAYVCEFHPGVAGTVEVR